MKITEQQMFDYMFCPAKYDLKYIKNIDIQDNVSMPRLLNKVAKYFYINLLDGKICSANDLKSKWDNICKQYPQYVDGKKNLEGMGMLINLINWASRSKIVILDVDTKYNIVVDDVELEGNMDPILAGDRGTMELLVTNFSSKLPDQIEIDMKLKHTLDTYAFSKVFSKELSRIRIHSVKQNVDSLSMRGSADHLRLLTAIKGVAKGIEAEAFYPRENVLCSSCTARDYCKYWHK